MQQVLLNSNDPETVAEAIPAYLVLQEALLANDPDNETMLIATARLYASFAALLFEAEPERLRRLNDKALSFAQRAACLHNSVFCQIQQRKYSEFSKLIEEAGRSDLDQLFALGSAWAGWIKTHKSDWRAVAQLAQVKLLMKRISALDESYRDGEPFLYLALLESVLPPALGGNPELAKRYFEKAQSLSGNKNLMIDVLYAQYYARMMFDRELHDSLLKNVIAANPRQDGLTLSNTLAQKQAAALLQSAEDYF